MRPQQAINRRRWLALAAAICALPFTAARGAPEAGEPWPSRPIRLLVPTGPGGVPDIRARWLADRLSALLGQPVLVENRPGAGGNLAMEAAARSAPDGYTLVMTHSGLVLNPLLYERMAYDLQRDFVAITRVGVGPLLLLVGPRGPLASVQDLIQAARAKPGGLSFGSPGIGTPPHLACELLLQETAISGTHVPYTNPMQVLSDIIAGNVQWAFEGVAAALPLVQSGRLRALAVTALQRLPSLPEVPTMVEAGLPKLVFSTWTGLAAPVGTPAAVIGRLYRDIARLLATEEATQWFASVGNQPGGEPPEASARVVRSDFERWSGVAKAAGLSIKPP